MGKDSTPPKFAENQAGATAKFVRVPPRKARLVIDAVRGKYVSDALAILKFVPNFAAEAISDVIKSAVANAENSRPHSEETGRALPPLVAENLRLVRAFVDEGPRIKRLQPRAQGRAYRIVKRMCHISVVVEEVAPKPRPQRAQRASRRAQQAGRAAAVAGPATEAAETKPKRAPKTAPAAEAAPVAVSSPVPVTAPEKQVPTSENVQPVAQQTDHTDEIGAPVTTPADVQAELAENNEQGAAAEAPGAVESGEVGEAGGEEPKAE